LQWESILGMTVCLVRRSLAVRAASVGEMPIGLADFWSAAIVW
jgi:hypothetical protein